MCPRARAFSGKNQPPARRRENSRISRRRKFGGRVQTINHRHSMLRQALKIPLSIVANTLSSAGLGVSANG
jgi:hypothetical protein